MTLTKNMIIGTKKIITYKVDEIKAKKFYDRVMSENNPVVTIEQLNELKQTTVFINLNITYNHMYDRLMANMDGKNMVVLHG